MKRIFVCGLQFRENVAAWVCFHDRKDVFKEFMERVLRLKEVSMSLSLSLCIVIYFPFISPCLSLREIFHLIEKNGCFVNCDYIALHLSV